VLQQEKLIGDLVALPPLDQVVLQIERVGVGHDAKATHVN
jgi:hypothetical protein